MSTPVQFPPPAEYAPFYRAYLEELPAGDVVGLLQRQQAVLASLPGLVAPEKETFGYAPGKWTVRQVVAHLGHTERVFGYRAFRFAHGDLTALPGFDENAYVEGSTAADQPIAHLVDELVQLRGANLRLFAGLNPDQWLNVGSANGYPASVRALAFIIAGHAAHHLRLLRDRYGMALELWRA